MRTLLLMGLLALPSAAAPGVGVAESCADHGRLAGLCAIYCEELGCATEWPVDANACDLTLQAWQRRNTLDLPYCLEVLR